MNRTNILLPRATSRENSRHDQPHPAPAPTAQYGEYILSYQDCRLCHGKDLAGGKVAPSFTQVKLWKLEQFIATLRAGTDPDGHHLDSEEIPWRKINKLDDIELTALYEYLDRLPENSTKKWVRKRLAASGRDRRQYRVKSRVTL